MRECQLCGAKSWGPIKDSTNLARVAMLYGEMVIDRYRQCDSCGSVAALVVIEKPAPDAEFSEHVSHMFGPYPSQPDSLSEAAKTVNRMADLMPKPQTRLERIVLTLLRSRQGLPPCDSHWLVSHAREIEKEMQS